MTETPELTITSLRWDPYVSECSGVPYLVVNCTFKVDPNSHLWESVKAESEEYCNSLSVDDPKKYEQWITGESVFGQLSYPGYYHAWVQQDPVWSYIEKFDTFWVREWVADCPVVRAAIAELEFYKNKGHLGTVYRSTDSCIILRHLRTIDQYWY